MTTISFSRADAAMILNLSQKAVAELFGRNVPARDLEAYLRDSFLRLYKAEAAALASVPVETETETEIELGPGLDVQPQSQSQPQPEPESMVTHSVAEFEAGSPHDRPDLRIAPRYVPRRQLGGSFRQVRFTILQLSTTGLRIRHDDTLRPGDSARLSFALMKPPRTFAMEARVVWTSIAQRSDGPSFCISGLRVTAGADQLRAAIDALRESRELQMDEEPPRRTNSTPVAITGLSDDEVASIIRAVRTLTSDPVEANRWYTRARFALSDRAVREKAPQRGRDRDEAVGVWEFLDRKIDLAKIAGVVTWLRQTRSASAVQQ